ncbi:unnamed protein product [Rotaria sp. Silwood2]|nr:unnamed protein product [Rotaria sp. Silwood2]CAF4612340.1 unnamed protein product [Rotaria sp. Silwood2]CAF4754224.1 unnamed protein product [Rotaria sp. Silwood2]
MTNTTELSDHQMEQKLKYQKLFDYTLSTPWYPREPKWSSKQIPKSQRRIQYPFLIQWNPMNIKIESISLISSSHHHQRSSSTRPSRRTQTVGQLQTNRSTSAPHRQFIIILTNNPDLLRQTRAFQPQMRQNIQTTVVVQNGTTNNGTANNNSNHREEILNNLLRVELREAASDYLTRTRRSYPIHCVFDMSDIETQQL